MTTPARDELAPYSRMPGYSKVAQALRERVHRGLFRPGQQLPPIRELAAHYRVSRSTAHLAVKQLVADGLLEIKQGSGTFVREAKTAVNPLLPTAEQFQDAGRHTRFSILGTGWVQAHEQTVLALGIHPESKVWTTVGTLYVDNVPMLLELFEMTEAMADLFMADSRKQRRVWPVLGETFGRASFHYAVGKIDILSERYISEVLGLPGHTSFFEVWRTILRDGEPLMTSCMGIRGDKLHLDLAAQPGAASGDGAPTEGEARRAPGATMRDRFSEFYT